MSESFQRHIPDDPMVRDKFRGCLLAGAVGDALGAPVEFMKRRQIVMRYGEPGICDYPKNDDNEIEALITDDTQMTLFTAEGLLRANMRCCTQEVRSFSEAFANVTAHAYLRWLYTQGETNPLLEIDKLDGWLIGHEELFARRAPGNTCLSSLRDMRRHFANPRIAYNTSKGCGGVMRMAPVGMFFAASKQFGDLVHREQLAFETGLQLAALTHGHPTGYLSSGAFSLIVMLLFEGQPLRQAIETTLQRLTDYDQYEETFEAIDNARVAATNSPNNFDTLASLGEGWIAEEALAIALYAALSTDELPLSLESFHREDQTHQQNRMERGIVLAVNHSGDSDSTGAICGNLLGAMYGQTAIPPRWLAPLELRNVIEEMADDLATFDTWDISNGEPSEEQKFYTTRYPGW